MLNSDLNATSPNEFKFFEKHESDSVHITDHTKVAFLDFEKLRENIEK